MSEGVTSKEKLDGSQMGGTGRVKEARRGTGERE